MASTRMMLMNTISKSAACSAKSVLLVLIANKPITKQNLLASLIQEVEQQHDEYFQKLHRAAIEMIGVNGR